jgi:hypothetical protein
MTKKYKPITDAEAEEIERETLERDKIEPRIRSVRYDGEKTTYILICVAGPRS